MKKWICLFLSLLLLTGCAAAPGTTGIQMETRPTVEDIFTLPTSTVPVTHTLHSDPSVRSTT